MSAILWIGAQEYNSPADIIGHILHIAAFDIGFASKLLAPDY